MTLDPGTYRDLSNWDYHNKPECHALSKGGIDRLLSTPAHFKAQMTSKALPSKEMVEGGAFHIYALQPDQVEHEVIVKKNAPKAERDELYFKGKYLIDKETEERFQGMLESIGNHETAYGLLYHEETVKEESIFWDDPTFGFKCKCRPDIRRPSLELLTDLKTTKDASPAEFSRSCANYNYHVQAAWYLAGINAVQSDWYRDFLFVCVEKSEPFAVAIYRASQLMLDIGRNKIKSVLGTYADCLRSNKWPAYPDEVQELDLPGWAT